MVNRSLVSLVMGCTMMTIVFCYEVSDLSFCGNDDVEYAERSKVAGCAKKAPGTVIAEYKVCIEKADMMSDPDLLQTMCDEKSKNGQIFLACMNAAIKKLAVTNTDKKKIENVKKCFDSI